MHYSYNESSKSATIYVKVKTGSKEDYIVGFCNMDDLCYLKMSIRELPIDGKANKAIIKFLAKSWNLKQNQLEISKGRNQKIKSIKVYDVTKDEIEEMLEGHAKSRGIQI